MASHRSGLSDYTSNVSANEEQLNMSIDVDSINGIHTLTNTAVEYCSYYDESADGTYTVVDTAIPYLLDHYVAAGPCIAESVAERLLSQIDDSTNSIQVAGNSVAPFMSYSEMSATCLADSTDEHRISVLGAPLCDISETANTELSLSVDSVSSMNCCAVDSIVAQQCEADMDTIRKPSKLWIKPRKTFPTKWLIGEKVDVASMGVWCPATVIDIFSGRREINDANSSHVRNAAGIRVHYDGWAKKFDENILDDWRVNKRGHHVFYYKAWVKLPDLPPWPCVVCDRLPVHGDKENISFLKTESKLFVRLCGEIVKPLKPWRNGAWISSTLIHPFSKTFDIQYELTKRHSNKSVKETWEGAVSKLCLMSEDSNNSMIFDFDFTFDGTYEVHSFTKLSLKRKFDNC
jgi:hypothetical protein